MSAHTPGPWHARRDGPTVIIEPIKAALTILSGPEGYQHTQDANARLIAAAPSMYDAIREALENCETCRDDGQPNCCRCLTFAGIVRCIDGEESQR